MTPIERQLRNYISQAWRNLWVIDGSKVVIDGELEYDDGSTQPITVTIQVGEKKGGKHGH